MSVLQRSRPGISAGLLRPPLCIRGYGWTYQRIIFGQSKKPIFFSSLSNVSRLGLVDGGQKAADGATVDAQEAA